MRINTHKWEFRIGILLIGLILFSPTFYTQVVNEDMKLVASDRRVQDLFGETISISGDYAIVGTRNNRDVDDNNTMIDAGAAYIFERNQNNEWIEVQKLVASDRTAEDRFANSVAISGNFAVVGAVFEDHNIEGEQTMEDAGSAYIFERNEVGNWIEVQKIIASDRSPGDEFGHCVSISGNTAIIGAIKEDEDANGGATKSNPGSAYLFERDSNGVWNQTQKIVASNRMTNYEFGVSVCIDDDYCVVGSKRGWGISEPELIEYFGTAYVFKRDENGIWSEMDILFTTDPAHSYFNDYGHSVSISGETVVVGCPGITVVPQEGVPGGDAGAAFVYQKNEDETWAEIQKLTSDSIQDRDYFGIAVAISGDNILVGATNHDFVNDEGPSANYFKRDINGYWNHVQRMEATHYYTQDWFGKAVAVSDETLMVGAFRNITDEQGLNGLYNSGAAHIFEINSITSVNTIDEEIRDKITIAPNPNSGEFQLFSSANGGVVNIVTMEGKTVLADYKINSTIESLNISHFESGMYLLHYTADGIHEIKKMIIE